MTSSPILNCIMHTTLALHPNNNILQTKWMSTSSRMQWTQVDYKQVWAWRIGRAPYWKWQGDPILQEEWASFSECAKDCSELQMAWKCEVLYTFQVSYPLPNLFLFENLGNLLEVFHNFLLSCVSKSFSKVCVHTNNFHQL